MKSIHIVLICLSCFVLLPFISNAQNSEKGESFILSGKVIDAATLEGIPYSHIKIDDTYWGVICDSLGFFKVQIKPNQSLKVSSLGFAEQIIPVTSEITDGTAFQELQLNRTSYMLEEVDIYSLGTWSQFKENFVNMELPEEKNVTGGWDFGNMKQYMQAALAMDRPGVGVGISINRKFKDRKQREHVAKLKLTEGKINILKTKFNKQLVQDITGETGERLNALMVYINEREHFTYQTRDIYIAQRIKALYDTFAMEYVDGEYEYALDDSTKTLRNHLRPGN
ncbi:carboxypeptidase-like protein [Ancylomarina subtilis]|uniref:Carboxypeptidase-like protein n=1 Tax=Ancylomarina subtilis TaxID=1639035 RepID=A0A4Q7VM12_9BACT|nr:carboxypeptidase-like regulatory domain-containing protein [Ancylomarina subtilis]RZT97346.1 carboxypeptidase-like protein [Ancylomarina subtilis]